MEVLAHSHNANASGSTFTPVRGDQVNHNYNGPTTIYYSISLFGSQRASSSSPPGCDSLSRPITDAETAPTTSPFTTLRTAEPFSAFAEATALIEYISKPLVDPTDLSNSHRDLQLVLETLRQILRLAKCAVRAYEDKPLGPSLTKAITPEVERCCVLLWELRNKVHDTWMPLMCTRISNLWRQVFRRQWDGDELASLKRRLYNTRHSLGIFIMALNSYVILCLSYIDIR